jgi:hypothetical protein
MLVSGVNLARTEYDLHSSHDLSKFLGGVAFSLLILASGIVLIRKSTPPGSADT